MNGPGNFFVSLKRPQKKIDDHLTTRLINSSKNEIGTISKHILDQINKKLVSKLRVNE